VTSRPWMPFYIGDYLADTRHLTVKQHGAYLLLIMHYWKDGGLPDDDLALAKLLGLERRNFVRHYKQMLAQFFHDGWHHKRIDLELAKHEIIVTRRAVAGKRGGLKSGILRTILKAKRQANGSGDTEVKRSKWEATTIENTKPSEYASAREAAAPPQKAASDKASGRLKASPELEAVISGKPRRKPP
jgi:uncharacterized protein YdaU (DUF1376 family)